MIISNNKIGTQKESLLHRSLKLQYTEAGGKNEVSVDGWICDIVNPNDSIVEIQTKNLSSLYLKLQNLLLNHKVTVIHPIAVETLITKKDPESATETVRKSPKKGSYTDIFLELTKLYPLLFHANFTLRVLLIKAVETRIADGKGSWRRKGVSITNRELIKIIDELVFKTRKDYASLLPDTIPDLFTVSDIQKNGFRHAGKAVWVLRKMGIITLHGKKGRAYLYTRKE